MLLFNLMSVTIQDILTQINAVISQHTETPALDAQVLVAYYLEKPRSWVMAHPEASIDDHQYNKIINGMNRLEHGEPLPYVIGQWEFYGLDFKLTSEVLIPRPETELLVENGISWLLNHPNQRKAVDVGTGSGCIGITLAKNIPDLHVLMVDISLGALKVAQDNAEKHGLSDRMDFRRSDLLEGIDGFFSLICANLPYIPNPMLRTLSVAKREPRIALDGGLSGTELIHRLLDQSRNHLAPGGIILLEIESSQGAEVRSLASSFYPASHMEILKDLAGFDRCIKITPSSYIIHLCQEKEWQDAQGLGIYKNKSLDHEGFIHCSQPHQILQVANRFYQGIPELILLWIDPEKITSDIRWEAADSALYPHIYGPINLDAVSSVTNFNSDDDGIYRLIHLPD
jgi:release factor glutamine methyltransferase